MNYWVYKKGDKIYCSHCGKSRILKDYHDAKNWNKSKTKRCYKCKSIKHGNCIGKYTKTYMVWASMIQRCTNQNNKQYKDYGGRGITIDPSWKNYENFIADMGLKPNKLTLDRIDNNQGYNKNNCRWVDYNIQASNRRARKLTKTQVERIKKLLDLGELQQKIIAEMFNVSKTTITEIKKGRTHVK